MRTIRYVTVLTVVGLLSAMALTPALANRLAGSPSGGAPFSAELDGFQEIDPVTGQPGAGDLEASGFARATINPGQGVACYELEHDVEPDPFGFHIHVGEAGENGPIVVNFFTDPAGVVPDSGCVDIDRDLARDILRNPEGYYFNLHNAPFPAGAIRGQLSASSR
jgi:hypothetical protein